MLRRISALGLCATASLTTKSSLCDDENTSFSPSEFRAFEVKKVTQVSPNTKLFTVALPSKDHRMGLPTASCIMVKQDSLDKDGKVVARPYTPVSLDSDKGYFELLIKSYPEGNVSKYMHSLNVGDKVEVKGPFPKITYEANKWKTISLVAGGTGLAPMLQVIQESLRNPEAKEQMTLIFANTSEKDILMKPYLDELAVLYPRFKVVYVLDQPENKAALEKAGGYHGYVSEAILAKHLAPASADTMVMVCGPPGFMNAVSGGKTPDWKQGNVSGILKTLNYDESMVFKF